MTFCKTYVPPEGTQLTLSIPFTEKELAAHRAEFLRSLGSIAKAAAAGSTQQSTQCPLLADVVGTEATRMFS